MVEISFFSYRAWKNICLVIFQGPEQFEEKLHAKLSEATEDQRKELCKLLSDHFDPNVAPPQIVAKPRIPRKSDRKSYSKDKDQATSSDIPTTPETTASNTSTSSPSKSNGVVTPNVESPKHEPGAKVAVNQDNWTTAWIKLFTWFQFLTTVMLVRHKKVLFWFL